MSLPERRYWVTFGYPQTNPFSLKGWRNAIVLGLGWDWGWLGLGGGTGVGPRLKPNWCGFRPKTGPFLGLKSMFLGRKERFKESSGRCSEIENYSDNRLIAV